MRSLIILLVLFRLSLGHSISKRDTKIINKQIDELIKDFNSLVSSGGVESITVDDFNVDFEKKTRLIKLKGTFTARNGVVTDLSTMRRTADAVLSATATTVTIGIHLGLGDLEVYYEHYKATLGKLGVSGSMRLRVETNSVYLQLTSVFEDEETCSTVVDQGYVEALDGFSVEVSDLGALRWIYEKVAEWAINKFKEDIRQKLEESLIKLFKNRNSIVKLCEVIRYI